MDEMRIGSGLLKGIVAKAIKKVLKKKFNVDVDVMLNEFYITNDGEKASVHLNVNAEMTSKALGELAEEVI